MTPPSCRMSPGQAPPDNAGQQIPAIVRERHSSGARQRRSPGARSHSGWRSAAGRTPIADRRSRCRSNRVPCASLPVLDVLESIHDLPPHQAVPVSHARTATSAVAGAASAPDQPSADRAVAPLPDRRAKARPPDLATTGPLGPSGTSTETREVALAAPSTRPTWSRSSSPTTRLPHGYYKDRPTATVASDEPGNRRQDQSGRRTVRPAVRGRASCCYGTWPPDPDGGRSRGPP